MRLSARTAALIISALLVPEGSPAKVLRAWLDGAYELVVSPQLVDELESALGYPKLRKSVTQAETEELVDVLGRETDLRDDPSDPAPVRSRDPGDDYLISLASAAHALLALDPRAHRARVQRHRRVT